MNVDLANLRVLIAESHLTVAESLGQIVSGLGGAVVAAQVTTAGEAFEQSCKVGADLALIDLALSPDCALVGKLHAELPDLRIIVLTEREADQERLLKAFASGAVGAIYKEDSFEELTKALTSTVASPLVPQEATAVLLESYIEALSDKRRRDLAVIEALASAVEARDATTGAHNRRVTELGRRCLEKVDPSLAENEEVVFGFMLHDVGKIGVPDRILNKPSALDNAEWEVMSRHPEIGVHIVDPIGFSDSATEIILSHHEHWDGSGYPRGLSAEEIPVTARAFAVADAFDAMTSDRPYRSALTPERALDNIQSASGVLFDPEITKVFVDLTG